LEAIANRVSARTLNTREHRTQVAGIPGTRVRSTTSPAESASDPLYPRFKVAMLYPDDMNNDDNVNPEGWVRMPPNGGRCPLTGLSHGRLYRLLSAAGGAIRTVSLREEGRNRGTRLIDPKSLLAYLGKLADTQAAQGAAK
jgi:hypothetical protein